MQAYLQELKEITPSIQTLPTADTSKEKETMQKKEQLKEKKPENEKEIPKGKLVEKEKVADEAKEEEEKEDIVQKLSPDEQGSLLKSINYLVGTLSTELKNKIWSIPSTLVEETMSRGFRDIKKGYTR